jgi:hypothetical protein
MPQAAGYFPGMGDSAHAVPPPAGTLSTSAPANLGNILYFMLPQLEQQQLYMSLRGWTMDAFNTGKLVPPPQLYICPSETTADPGSIVRPDWHVGWGGGNYVPNVQAFNHWTPTGINAGPNPFTHPELRHLIDGTSNTAAFAERYAICALPAIGYEFGRTHWLGTPAAQYDSIFAWNAYTVPPAGVLAGRDKYVGREEVPQIAPATTCDETDRSKCPPNICNPLLVQTPHAAMNLLLFDGSVQSIGGEIDWIAWRAYILPADEGAPPRFIP